MTVGIAILGSTGSIGQSALRVLARHRDRFHVSALTANSNATLLAEQAAALGTPFVGLVSGGPRPNSTWHMGPECMTEAASLPDAQIVLNAVVGAVGMDATLAALRAGKRVALA
ncbi:MAG: 1-deoxy-D-xylulose-5-phosphate reductoisomerase, partial [Gemmatimonadaceae bacterium]